MAWTREIGLWKSGTESSTIAAFFAIEMSLNEMDDVYLTVRMVSKLTTNPKAACPRKSHGWAPSSSKPPARRPGSSTRTTPRPRQPHAHGLNSRRPSSAFSLWPPSRSCIRTSLDASVSCEPDIAS
eukprot:1764409-Prymnesium_polylepis.1